MPLGQVLARPSVVVFADTHLRRRLTTPNTLPTMAVDAPRMTKRAPAEGWTMTDRREQPNGIEVRLEHDSLGDVAVPAQRYWGAQTQRSLEHFRIGHDGMPLELVHAIALVKQAAAVVNRSLGRLPFEIADAIATTAADVVAGRLDDEFPLSVWQTGSGTQTNMNVNEVIANRASERLGGPRGNGRLVHPNDHVNLGQSSNDVVPTAMHLAARTAVETRLLPALDQLTGTLQRLSASHGDVIKLGRTHLQDAVPLTFGQEVSGWAAQLTGAREAIVAALAPLAHVAIGGTAVGTGLNAPAGFGDLVTAELTRLSGRPVVPARNAFAALAAHDDLVTLHGALRRLAVALIKIANDVRWLASGPRAGLGEIRIPENEPGSSIMPGKVNPTQSEALLMLCAQVIGNDVALGIGAASGSFELNTAKPLIAFDVLWSTRLLADGCRSFDEHCARGIEPNLPRMQELLDRSLMLVTALTPRIGYDRAAKIALKAHHEGTSIRDAILSLRYLPAEEIDEALRPEQLLGPGGRK
jgi:fumarate hydratase class II